MGAGQSCAIGTGRRLEQLAPGKSVSGSWQIREADAHKVSEGWKSRRGYGEAKTSDEAAICRKNEPITHTGLNLLQILDVDGVVLCGDKRLPISPRLSVLTSALQKAERVKAAPKPRPPN